ncbi:MAG TPA: hypothetical protein DCP69_10150 [Candidatus Omnitrophica bacterium]|nr:hypothetical protein [Candidatus Omnitrophota bacterium]
MLTMCDLKGNEASSPCRRCRCWHAVLPIAWGAPLTWRLRDAWEVLRGRAQAVCEHPDRFTHEKDGA